MELGADEVVNYINNVSLNYRQCSHRSYASVSLSINHRPQVEESIDEGVGDGVGAGEDEQTVLQPGVQLVEGIFVD